MREKIFRISLEPVNEHITTDALLRKLRLMAAGCGLRVNSAELIDNQDDTTTDVAGPTGSSQE
ncbi:hypothetical protein [Gimesia panareensis]|uniref:Uncharacterized protein n=1 Tax=Gimesia panareensis TaxID=2527978 RepID=A0A518FQV3_9PLAN|nr:hypothetical protein [Gimesia panareensis]QDT29385.1 hypothetical protein Enr10x_47380 [Gimesia panareensis]QDU52427.1 hypothetical protein Pan110_48050 [Gimesia panareensis]QDV18731.1 hypothetical protein Pan153_33920 [Gimesia panareensis]QDV20205.1 hypothetical protein Pan153_48780 [Gimesia panareensis]